MRKISLLFFFLLAVCLFQANAQFFPSKEWNRKYSQCDSVIIGFSENKDPIVRHIMAVSNTLETYLMSHECSISGSLQAGSGEQVSENTYDNKKHINYDVIDVYITDSSGYYVAVKILDRENYLVLLDGRKERIGSKGESECRLQLNGVSVDSLEKKSQIKIESDKRYIESDGFIQNSRTQIGIEYIDTSNQL